MWLRYKLDLRLELKPMNHGERAEIAGIELAVGVLRTVALSTDLPHHVVEHAESLARLGLLRAPVGWAACSGRA